MRWSILRGICAGVLIGGLLFNTEVFADQGKKEITPKDILSLQLPFDWGLLRDSFNSGTDKIVINIQDAHANLEAQRNIARIIDYLRVQYNLKFVALEGAFGDIDTTVFSSFPDKDVIRDVSEYFLKEGKISGAEYAAINSEQKLFLSGVEDFQLYQDNLDVFYKAQKIKPQVIPYISVLKDALDKVRPYIYNAQLTEFYNAKQSRHNSKISFSEYIIKLSQFLNNYALPITNYPYFEKLRRSVTLEQKVDFIKANQERAELINELTERVTQVEDLAALVEKSLDFKKGILSPAAYTGFLNDLAFKVRLSMIVYPNFGAYVDYILAYDKTIGNTEVFQEIKDIEQTLREKAYTTDSQRQWDKLYRYVEIFYKMANLSMLAEDLKYYEQHCQHIKINSFLEFFEEQNKRYMLELNLSFNLAQLDSYLPQLEEFYEFAYKRDITLVENTLKHMNNQDISFAVLVTGGFHTERLIKVLKTQHISYMVITPHISQHDTTPYLEIMGGRKTLLDSFIDQMQN